MRLRTPLGSASRAAAGAHRAPPTGGAALDGSPFGSWAATRWQYTRREPPQRQVDVVCDLGGSVTLSLSEGTYVLTWDLGHGSRSLAGAVALERDRITLRPHGTEEAEALWFRRSGDTLALSADDSAWAFDGEGHEEPAAFVAVLVRL